MKIIARRLLALFGLVILYSSSTVQARNQLDQSLSSSLSGQAAVTPAYCLVQHRIGVISLTIQNNGTFGFYRNFFSGGRDCFTGDRISFGCEYPRRSSLESLYYGALWVGAVVGNDSIVTTGMAEPGNNLEFHPDASPLGDMIHRSLLNPDAPEFKDAISDEDYIAVYYDTLQGASRDFLSNRPHAPLYIEVTQKSYAWSYSYAEDIILIDLSIKNIGIRNLKEVYVGIFMDGNVGYNPGYPFDDLTGFVETYPFKTSCLDYEDKVYVAWMGDNNGDPIDGQFVEDAGIDFMRKSAPHVTGTRVLRVANEDLKPSYNWWIASSNPTYDFGPRFKNNPRDFKTGGLGNPAGDRNKYYLMKNGEIDYDMSHTMTVGSLDQTWLYPSRAVAYYVSRGMDTKYLLSFGPFDIRTSESIPLTFAYFGGENFHNDAGNGKFLGFNPDRFRDHLDFSDLMTNARWASWIFDNPGVDTDGDGFSGNFIVCVLDSTLIDSQWYPLVAETTFFTGDGVPDFRGAAPPPAPDFSLRPTVAGIHVQFNGQRSERSKDFLTNRADFEGFNVYVSRDERISSYSLYATFDYRNFDKFVWNRYNFPVGKYELHDLPYTEEELRCMYGSSCDDSFFDPNQYGPGNPFSPEGFPDSIFYFAPHGGNASQFGLSSPIKKVYPEALNPPPGTNLDTLSDDYLTNEGNLKYYEYEITIENLLPTVPYWVSITAFDYGSPKAELGPLETALNINTQMIYPAGSENQLSGEDKKVFVYPNPYRIDGNYRSKGFEGRIEFNQPSNRVREIHFVNLPPNCIIRIFSLDGDLIKELSHNKDPLNPNSSHAIWDIISRNTQEIVSGLYYWVVEDPNGKIQMGKLVIIM